MDVRQDRAKSIFLNALEIAPEARRRGYLDAECAGDEALRREVEELLEHHGRIGGFLESAAPPAVPAAEEPPARAGPGALIGHYKLLEQIGEGGFGVVYMAEQQEPVRRKVALKVIKPGMDSRQVIARFEAERQALALMDHPNIARVFDAGETDSGRPYFVMELVQGIPVTDYCDRESLPIRERLGLFVSVCEAVQHAHQKGIIHRDLKPSNVMVAPYDGQPVVKVIDFGIAKATGPRLTDKTLFTELGQVVGTLEYMSPEQAELNNADIDTRSDIYSLGVLLYELLTGTTPLDRKRLGQGALLDMLRLVREEEPPWPSRRLSESKESLTSISAQRQTEPATLRRLVRGELDWIVMKSLEKVRSRRYETANAFALDVQRYLADEPVQACPPSTAYRFRKFARRNKGTLASASGVALVVALALVGLSVSNLLIRQEQARTREEKHHAEVAQKLAEQRAEEVRHRLARLKSANALVERARFDIDFQSWDDADVALTKAINLRPDHVRAWKERGELYARLGLWDLAAIDLSQSFDRQESDLSWPWVRVALLRAYVGNTAGCRAVGTRMYARFRGTYIREIAMDMVRTCTLLPGPTRNGSELVEVAQSIVAADPGPPWFPYILGLAHYRAGQYELAIRRLRESLAADPRWGERSMNYPVLAMAFYRLGRKDDARQALAEAARAIEQWTNARFLSGKQGNWVIHQGATDVWPAFWLDWVDCLVHYREARALMGLPPPPDDPRLHVFRARAFARLRWTSKAIKEYAAALKLSPRDDQILLEAHRTRAYLDVAHDRWRQAAAEFEHASQCQLDDTHLWWFQAAAWLAAGDVQAYRRVCAGMLKRFEGTRDPAAAGDVIDACIMRPDALSDMARLVPLGRVAARSFWDSRKLAAALYRAGLYDEAERCFTQVAKVYRLRGDDWLFLAMTHHRLGHTADAQACLARAVQWVREASAQELNDDVGGTQTAWGGWTERVTVPLLLREAESLIRGQPEGSARSGATSQTGHSNSSR